MPGPSHDRRTVPDLSSLSEDEKALYGTEAWEVGAPTLPAFRLGLARVESERDNFSERFNQFGTDAHAKLDAARRTGRQATFADQGPLKFPPRKIAV